MVARLIGLVKRGGRVRWIRPLALTAAEMMTAPVAGTDGIYRYSLSPAIYRIYAYLEVSGTYLRGEKPDVIVSHGKTATVDIIVTSSPDARSR